MLSHPSLSLRSTGTMVSSDFSSGFLLDFACSAYTIRYDGCGPPHSIACFHSIPLSLRRRVLDGCSSRFFAASLAFAIGSQARLPLFPISGLTCRRCKTGPELVEGFTSCYGLLLCSFSSKGYIASARAVAHPHWMPATWPPVRYQDWTFTSKYHVVAQADDDFSGHTSRC